MHTPLIFNLGVWEIVIIVAVIALIFGAKKIPDVMTGVAKGIKGFKKEMKDNGSEEQEKDEKK